MSTVSEVVIPDFIVKDVDIFTPGNLVRLKEDYEDGDGPLVIYVTDHRNEEAVHQFSGVAIVSNKNPDVGHHTGELYKFYFEQFVGSITLTGSL